MYITHRALFLRYGFLLRCQRRVRAISPRPRTAAIAITAAGNYSAEDPAATPIHAFH